MGSKTVAVLLSAAALAALCGSAYGQVQPTGSWSSESGGNTFYYGSAVSDGTYLYLVGGYQYGTVTNYPYVMAQFRRYDPVTNAWTVMPQMAAGTANGSSLWGVRYHAAAFHGGRVFVFGGYVYSGTVGSNSYSTGYSSAIRAFDFATQTWSTLGATLTSTRYYHQAATMGDLIYIAGGASSSALDIFNPATGTLSSGTAMPGYLYYHTLAAVPALNKIYAMGGYGTAGYTGINYEYTPQDGDPGTPDVGGSWTTRLGISNNGQPLPLYYSAAMTLNNRVYLAGGYANGDDINQTHEYNPITNTWAQRASMAVTHYRHGAAAVNGKGYVYGGLSNSSTGEEFTPPSFGTAPTVNGPVTQAGSRDESALQAAADPTSVDGWTNNQVTFTADVQDPDSGQQIRLRVQVKPASATWTQTSQITSLDTGLKAQGLSAVTFNVPAGGDYDWRWRVEDAYANSYPEGFGAWTEGFGNQNSPDFRSDQEPPSEPVAQTPTATDIEVGDPIQGPVVLSWQGSTDNGPEVGIQYELQVATDGGFDKIEAQLFSPAGTDEYPTTLTVSRYSKFWRVRARDIGGNLSEWSAPLSFRVTYNDGSDHGAGDASKGCGLGASISSAVGPTLLGALILGLALLRRKVAST